MVERDKVGGRCLNYACIPAKAVLRSADLLTEIRDGGEFGLRVSGVEIDYPAVQARREKVVAHAHLRGGGLFKKNGIDVIEGDAALTRRRRVCVVGEQAIAAGSVILATGSVPRPIPGVGVRRAGDRHRGGVGAGGGARRAWRSSARAPRAPRSPPASRAWAARCCCWRCSTALLPTEDADISRLVERGLKRQGIDVHTGTPVGRRAGAAELRVSFSYGDGARPRSTTS